MKIKYTFADGSISEVEVNGDIETVILDLDRQQYNSDHRQRRHNSSLEAYDQDGNRIASNEDIVADVIEKEEYASLHHAIEQLTPRQQYLIKEVFFKGRTIASIAREEGKDASTIRESLEYAKKKIKKFLS